MKNIISLFALLFCFDAVAAVPQKLFSGMPDYLLEAANAWAGIYSEFGPSAQIASYINQAQTNNVGQYLNAISILGFNNTAMALFETNYHIAQAFNVLNSPLVARRNACTQNLKDCTYGNRTLVIDANVFGSFSDYHGGENGDFKTQNTGFVIDAKSYISDGWLLGVEYTRSMTDTHDTRVYSDATGNSITLFSQYLARSGLFLNLGMNAGHISWNIDKTIAGISDNGTYDTEFYAGQMNFGIRMMRGRISMIPSVSVKYSFITADKYVDEALQEFDNWWYNTLTTSGNVDFSYDFIGSDFVVRPTLRLGGGYDAISRGTEKMRVQLVDNQLYNIPIESPDRAFLSSGIGVDFFNQYFMAGLNYMFDMRSDYTNHTISGKIKIAF